MRLFRIILLLVLLFSFPAVDAQEEMLPVTVRFWHAFGGGYLPYMERMIADFNQTHPDIVIEAVPQGSYEDVFTALETAVPHLVHLADVDSQRALDSGLFAPLTLDDGYFSTVLQSDMALPINLSMPMLYANADLLSGALPTTRDEISAVCEQLASACITWPIDAWLVENWLNGADFTPENMTAFATWWQELSNNRYYLRPRALADWEDAMNRFVGGEVAMFIGSSEDADTLTKIDEFEVLAAPMPGLENGFVLRGGAVWLTNAGTPEEQQAAQIFLNWLTNTENSVRWHKLTGFLPLRPLAVTVLEEQGWSETSPVYAAAVDLLANGQNNGQWRGPQREINLIVEESMQRIVQGNNIERTLADMQRRIEQANARYGQE